MFTARPPRPLLDQGLPDRYSPFIIHPVQRRLGPGSCSETTARAAAGAQAPEGALMSSRLTRIASVTAIAGLALTALAATGPAAAAAAAGGSASTTTPIKHVIVILSLIHI